MHLEALWFILTHPRRFIEVCKLHMEVQHLERVLEHMRDIFDGAGLRGHDPAQESIKAQINIIRIRIELLLDPSVELPAKET
jgi:hypothetical protein